MLPPVLRIHGYPPVLVGSTLKDWYDYDAACTACEIKLLVSTAEMQESIKAVLVYDKRKAPEASHGRAVSADIYTLLKHDRLEPSPEVPDVSKFEEIPPPVLATFWRPSAATITHHRNPLWCEEIGLTPEATLTMDYLHVLALGICGNIGSAALIAMIEANVYGFAGADPVTVRTLSTNRIRAELFTWYSTVRAGNQLSDVHGLTYGMLTTWHFKGDESLWMLRFVSVLLARYSDRLPLGADYDIAVSSLVHCIDLVKANAYVFPPEALRALVDATNTHMATLPKLGVWYRPKHHMWCHLVCGIGGGISAYAHARTRTYIIIISKYAYMYII